MRRRRSRGWEANGRSLAFVAWDTREPSNRRRKIAIALPTPLRDHLHRVLPSVVLALAGHLCHERIMGSGQRNYDHYKIVRIRKYKNGDNSRPSIPRSRRGDRHRMYEEKKNLERERTSGIRCRKIRKFLACRLLSRGVAALRYHGSVPRSVGRDGIRLQWQIGSRPKPLSSFVPAVTAEIFA